MLDFLAFAATLAFAGFGYLVARRFVRDRLRFVDGVQTIKAPIISGLVAWAVLMPLTWILPLIGAGTAILVGVGVGLGVRAGAKDIRTGHRLSSGSFE